ncbi:hypothetical protein D3C72_1951960 [compost metagenome]
MADAVDQLHVVDQAATERQAQRVEQGVLGFRLEHEIHDLALLFRGDVEALADLRDVTGQQQCRGFGQTLVKFLDGSLFQVRVPQGDVLAVRHHHLLLRCIGVPVEQARALDRHLARGFLQAGAAGIQGQLGEIGLDGLRLFQQLGQALHVLLTSVSRQCGR